ncbi:MAG TPA: hypothetical protein VIJ31_10645 [Acidothermaceae bacterium]
MSTPTLEAAAVTAAEVSASTPPVVVAGRAFTIAASGRALQLAIRAQLLRSVTRLWPALDPKRLDQTWPGWLEAMILLTNAYRGQSAVAAGASYRAAREHATQSPAPRSLLKLAPDAAPDWLARAYGFSGPGMLNRDVATPNTALSTTLGTASRIVLDAGRTTTIDTVHADPVAVGWYRVTDGSPCSFCALLASRRIAYKAEKTADFLSHDHCGCSAAPAFSRDQELPAISHDALAVYRESTKGVRGKDALAAFRKAWEARASA